MKNKSTHLQPSASPPDDNKSTGSTTDATEDSHDAPPFKRRKPTYCVRNEAIEVLHYQIKRLEDELRSCKSYAARESHQLKALYTDAVERNHLLLAGTESLLTAHMQALGMSIAFPLSTYTHLPRDSNGRRRITRFQYGHRVDAALLFMKERTRFLDLSFAHTNTQHLQLSNGDSISIHFDVTPFDPRFRPPEVYAAFQSFFVGLEAASDGTPTSSKNEVFECGQSRELSEHGGLEVVWNSISFVKLVKPSWSSGYIHAVGAMDSVDRDDRFQLDAKHGLVIKATTAMLLTETLTPRGHVVSLSRWRAVLYSASLTRTELQALESATTARWDAMIQFIDRRLESNDKSATQPEN